MSCNRYYLEFFSRRKHTLCNVMYQIRTSLEVCCFRLFLTLVDVRFYFFFIQKTIQMSFSLFLPSAQWMICPGKKFDLRLYLLVTSYSPLTAYIHRGGFARFSFHRFSMSDKEIDNNCQSHLFQSVFLFYFLVPTLYNGFLLPSFFLPISLFLFYLFQLSIWQTWQFRKPVQIMTLRKDANGNFGLFFFNCLGLKGKKWIAYRFHYLHSICCSYSCPNSRNLKLFMISRHGLEAVNRLFSDVQDMMIRTLLAVQKVRSVDKSYIFYKK